MTIAQVKDKMEGKGITIPSFMVTVIVTILLSGATMWVVAGQYKERVDSSSQRITQIEKESIPRIDKEITDLKVADGRLETGLTDLKEQVNRGFADQKRELEQIKADILKEIRYMRFEQSNNKK